jgi:hypothetical protein
VIKIDWAKSRGATPSRHTSSSRDWVRMKFSILGVVIIHHANGSLTENEVLFLFKPVKIGKVAPDERLAGGKKATG